MKNKVVSKSNKLKLLILSVVELMVFTALTASTIAWFTAVKESKLKTSQLSVQDHINYTIKSYNGNYNDEGQYVGYEDPGSLDDGVGISTVSDYSTDFTVVSDNALFSMNGLYPGIRYTLAIEVTSEYPITSNIGISLTKFTNHYSEEYTNYVIVNGEEYKIGFSDAVNVYSTSLANMNNTSATSLAKSFIEASSEYLAGENSSGDRFDFDQDYEGGVLDSSSTYGDYIFSNQDYNLGSVNDVESTDNGSHTAVIFLTFEFTNLPTSYYIYDGDSIDGSKSYWIKNTDGYSEGNSNVYFTTSFIMNNLFIRRI